MLKFFSVTHAKNPASNSPFSPGTPRTLWKHHLLWQVDVNKNRGLGTCHNTHAPLPYLATASPLEKCERASANSPFTPQNQHFRMKFIWKFSLLSIVVASTFNLLIWLSPSLQFILYLSTNQNLMLVSFLKSSNGYLMINLVKANPFASAIFYLFFRAGDPTQGLVLEASILPLNYTPSPSN